MIGYSGVSEKVQFNYVINNSYVKGSWAAKWNKNKIDLSLTGITAGSSKVTISLMSEKSGKVLAKKEITVKVTGSLSLSSSTASLDMVSGKTKTVNVSVSGANSTMKIKSSVKSGKSASCSLKSAKSGKYTLTVTGKALGKTEMRYKSINRIRYRNSSG